MENKLQPHDLQVEKLVLGTLMSSKDSLYEVNHLLKEDSFYDVFHQKIFKAIITIEDRGDSPDMITVHNELKKNNESVDAFKLAEICDCFTTTIYQHSAILHDKCVRRNLINIANQIMHMSFDETNDIVDIQSEAEENIKNLFCESDNSISDINEAIKGVQEQIERNNSEMKVNTGTLTGFMKFDEKSGGFQKSDFIVIAADTSQGKTSLSVSIALNAALNGSSISIYSMEMKKEQIAARMMSMQSGVPANQILYSKMLPEQFDKIDRGLSSLYNRHIYFDDRSTSNIDTIIASIRNLKKKQNIDGAIVDYLQILNVNMKGSSPEQQMGAVARRLKNLAKELDIWIVALSQLSRDHANPIPSLSRLRDSGQIGEAADIVMLIYRPEVYGKYYPEPFKLANTQGTAMIDVAKGRNIGILKFLVGFDCKTTKFYDMNEFDCYNNSTSEEEDPF